MVVVGGPRRLVVVVTGSVVGVDGRVVVVGR
jgi:hypothetical protein